MPLPLSIEVYSDYLCPWCYIATYRLGKIEEEFGEQVSLYWKSFPLLLKEDPCLYPSRRVQEAWRRAGEEEPALTYQTWPTDRKLPASSLPAQEAAKCARLQGAEAFFLYHVRLMQAFFGEGRDIGDRMVLLEVADEAGLDVNRFRGDLESGTQRVAVLTEYESLGNRQFGVPTAIFGGEVMLEGAVPMDMYRRAVKVLLQRQDP